MSPIKKICLGLEIIEKYNPNDHPEFNHDVIYAGVNMRDMMTEVDKIALDEMGWSYNKPNDCWQHF
jgi:hypothetical protein